MIQIYIDLNKTNTCNMILYYYFVTTYHIIAIDVVKKLFEYNFPKVLGNQRVFEVFRPTLYFQNLCVAF